MKKLTLAIITMIIGLSATAQQQPFRHPLDDLETVYKDENVTFRKLDDHTWVGSGNVMSSETMYIIEGRKRAILLDAGTVIPGLDKIVAQITDKPVTLMLTHVHPDHVGAVDCFDQVWLNPADTVMMPAFMPNYKGEVKYLKHSQKIRLGGRTLEVHFTPGHTPGSTTFLEIGTETGYSGDSYGNGNLLVFSDFQTLIKMCRESHAYFSKKGYRKFLCGHYFGLNAETLERIKLVETMATELLEGKVDGDLTGVHGTGLDRVLVRDHFRLNYSAEKLQAERESLKFCY